MHRAGSSAAQAAFPAVAAHLSIGCVDCATAVFDLMRLLAEPEC
jgi:hypothetical protein